MGRYPYCPPSPEQRDDLGALLYEAQMVALLKVRAAISGQTHRTDQHFKHWPPLHPLHSNEPRSLAEYRFHLGTGKGLVRLLHETESQNWKAFTLYTALYELRGHAETVRHRRQPGFLYRLPGAPTEFHNWREMRIAQGNFHASLEPAVLIVGEAISQHLLLMLPSFLCPWP